VGKLSVTYTPVPKQVKQFTPSAISAATAPLRTSPEARALISAMQQAQQVSSSARELLDSMRSHYEGHDVAASSPLLSANADRHATFASATAEPTVQEVDAQQRYIQPGHQPVFAREQHHIQPARQPERQRHIQHAQPEMQHHIQPGCKFHVYSI
jgi:hypothetical protein